MEFRGECGGCHGKHGACAGEEIAGRGLGNIYEVGKRRGVKIRRKFLRLSPPKSGGSAVVAWRRALASVQFCLELTWHHHGYNLVSL